MDISFAPAVLEGTGATACFDVAFETRIRVVEREAGGALFRQFPHLASVHNQGSLTLADIGHTFAGVLAPTFTIVTVTHAVGPPVNSNKVVAVFAFASRPAVFGVVVKADVFVEPTAAPTSSPDGFGVVLSRTNVTAKVLTPFSATFLFTVVFRTGAKNSVHHFLFGAPTSAVQVAAAFLVDAAISRRVVGGSS